MNTQERDIPGDDKDMHSGGSDDGDDRHEGGDFDLSGFAGDSSVSKPAGEKKPKAPAAKAPGAKAPYGAKGPKAGSYDKPKRAYGDRPPREGGFDRPKRAYGDQAPREGGYDRPKRAYGDRPPREGSGPRDGGFDRPKRAYGDRSPREGGFDRPKRAYGDRPPREGGFDRPKRDFGDRPPREGGFERPKRAYGDRASRDGGSERPKREFGDRPPREGASERPKRDFKDRAEAAPRHPAAPPGSGRPAGSFRNDSGARTPAPRRFATPAGTGPIRAPGSVEVPAFKPVSMEVKPWLLLKQDKGRWKESRFLLEGAKNVADALNASSAMLHEVFVDAEFKDKDLLAAFKKHKIKPITVTADDIRALSETEAPQGVIAVCNFATLKIDWNSARYVTVLDGVQDPGNVGAILRTSAALGMDAVVLGKGSCDPYNPKVVRSSVGALLGMPFETGEELGSKILFLRQKGFSVVATSSHAKQTLEQAKLRKKVAIIVGNEGAGTGASFMDMADAVVKIPLSKVESLNVAVAHGILSYQLIHGRE